MVLKEHKESREQLDSFKLVSLTLTPRGREILELLGTGNPPSKVAEAIGITKPTMTYWIKKFTKHGLIRLQVHDVYKIFDLTYLGLKILTGSDDARRTIVLEDYPIKYALVEGTNCSLRTKNSIQERVGQVFGLRSLRTGWNWKLTTI